MGRSRGILKGCSIACLVFIAVLVLSCSILAETSTPLSVWLYSHNYYFQGLVDLLHRHA